MRTDELVAALGEDALHSILQGLENDEREFIVKIVELTSVENLVTLTEEFIETICEMMTELDQPVLDTCRCGGTLGVDDLERGYCGSCTAPLTLKIGD